MGVIVLVPVSLGEVPVRGNFKWSFQVRPGALLAVLGALVLGAWCLVLGAWCSGAWCSGGVNWANVTIYPAPYKSR